MAFAVADELVATRHCVVDDGGNVGYRGTVNDAILIQRMVAKPTTPPISAPCDVNNGKLERDRGREIGYVGVRAKELATTVMSGIKL